MASPVTAPQYGWTTQDRAILSRVEDTRSRGHQLKRWFDQSSATQAQWFPIAQTFNPEDDFQGLFGSAPISGSNVEVMGARQLVFFDRPRTDSSGGGTAAGFGAQQIREFLFGHYLHLISARNFRRVEDYRHQQLPWLLKRLSWQPENKGTFGPSVTLSHDSGFGFRQLYYKLKASGRIGKFPERQRSALVDMREVGEKYEWLVLHTNVLNADLAMAPFGRGRPQMRIPVPVESYLVVDREMLDYEETPQNDVTARYGVGYALMNYQDTGSPFVYGPGQFEDAIQLNRFAVMRSGEIRAEIVLVGNQPKAVMNVLGFDPFMTYIRAANLVSGGLASSRLGISRDRLVKFILFNHCCYCYEALMTSLRTYHQVADWTDPAAFPAWLKNDGAGA